MAFVTGGITFAVGLAFLAGLALGASAPGVSSKTVAVIGGVVGAIGVLQFLAQVVALAFAAGAHRQLRRARVELEERAGQMRLLSRLGLSLEREISRRSIAGRALAFCLEDLGAAGVVYWSANQYGSPEAPELSRRSHWAGETALADSQRAVLARNAGRDGKSLVVEAGGRARELDVAHPPSGPFVLFLPLPGDEMCQGVLELHGTGESWAPGRWEMLPLLAKWIGLALQRGREYEELRERADEDYVTGLFNHGYMQVYLEKEMREARTRGTSLALLFVDVNNFKSFNDQLGHGAGDRVLQTVADQLRMMVDGVGAVGRSGGDEFMIVLPGASREGAETFIEAFQDWLSERAPAVNGIYRIRVSCGYAVYPEDAGNRHELLAAADACLYRNKRENAARVRVDGHGLEDARLGVYGLLDRIVETVHSRDAYARAHCERMAEHAILLARCLGLSPAAEKTLRLASLLHDVGRIGVPEWVLEKPGRLSPEEFELVKRQLSIAEHLIVDIPNAREVRDLVLLHHERWDGKGYPRGLKGEEIPYLARVLGVADAFAALTLDRPHRRAMSTEEALRELRRGAYTQFDPAVVAALCEALTRPGAEAVAPEAVASGA